MTDNKSTDSWLWVVYLIFAISVPLLIQNGGSIVAASLIFLFQVLMFTWIDFEPLILRRKLRRHQWRRTGMIRVFLFCVIGAIAAYWQAQDYILTFTLLGGTFGVIETYALMWFSRRLKLNIDCR